MSKTEKIKYKPDVGMIKRFIDTVDSTGTEAESQGGIEGGYSSEFSATVDLVASIRATDELFDEVDHRIVEQTALMRIPVDDPGVSKSLSILNGGDHANIITQSDWLRAVEMRSDPSSILSNIVEYDLMEMLLIQLKFHLINWLADIVENIPAVGGKIADALRDAAEKYEGKASMNTLIEKENSRRPRTLDELVRVGTGTKTYSLSEVLHADKIVNYINEFIEKPHKLGFDGAAVGLKPVVDSYKRSWKGTKDIVSVSVLGKPNGFVNITKEVSSDRTDIGKWLQKEGLDVAAPGIQAYRTMKKLVDDGGVREVAILGTQKALSGVKTVLGQYLTGQDLACCLLDNILKLSDRVSGKSLRLLKTIRLGLTFAFNGLSVDTGDLLNGLIDILNVALMAALGKVVTTFEEALDNWTLGVAKFFNDYARRKGEAWRRCYPFDELMKFILAAINDMVATLKAYIKDYVNTVALSHVELDKYCVTLKKREYARKMLCVMDLLVKGIETGIICKNQNEIDVVYTRPTMDDVKRFIDENEYRLTINPDEALKAYKSGSVTGNLIKDVVVHEGVRKHILTDISEDDLLTLQHCVDVFTENELEEISRGLQEFVLDI